MSNISLRVRVHVKIKAGAHLSVSKTSPKTKMRAKAQDSFRLIGKGKHATLSKIRRFQSVRIRDTEIFQVSVVFIIAVGKLCGQWRSFTARKI